MKLHRLTALVLALVMVFALLPAAAPAQAVESDDVCIQYTGLMVENTFRYLNEIYIETYPELGLRWNYGMEEDKRIMTEFVRSLTEGCATDREKVDAIISWIVKNIDYEENCNALYSYDVLYDGVGNCLGQAMLMQDMCRVAGIPAVWGDGKKGDMASMTVGDAQNFLLAGHAWCFVYVDGEWLLFDPVWGVNPYTDKEMIAQDYFLDSVEGITPVYDSSNQPPYRSPEMVFAYVDGKFMLYENGAPAVGVGHAGMQINITLSLDVTVYQGNDGNVYLEDPERRNEMVTGEVYRDGWYAYGYAEPGERDYTYYVTELGYAYENGINAHDVEMTYNGERYLFGNKMCIDPEDCRIQWGWLTVKAGYKGQILLPFEWERMRNDPLVEMVWKSENPDVATIDQNGVVTNYKEGVATFRANIQFKSVTEAPDIFLEDPEKVKELLDEGFVWQDGKLVHIHVNPAEYAFRVSFEEDIARPTAFGKGDAGQDDPQESIPQEGGNGGSDGNDIFVPSVDFVVDTVDQPEMDQILSDINEKNVLELFAESGSNALSFDAFLLEVAAGSGIPMEITIGDAVIALDHGAVSNLFAQLPSGLVTVELIPIQTAHLTAQQQTALTGRGVERIYAIGVRSGDSYIHELGGTATVTFPFAVKDGDTAGDYKVFYVSEGGSLEEMSTTVADGSVSFTTDHFSAYALLNTAVKPEVPAEKPSGSAWPVFAVGGAVLAVAAVVVVLILIKKRKTA